MNASIKTGLASTLIFLALATLPSVQAQTIAKNGAWLEQQFAKLIKDEKDNETPRFSFRGCQMKMDLDTKDKDVAVGMHMAWLLSDVRKISYRKDKDGHYTLLLDVPADKVNMTMNVGGFGGSFNQAAKDKPSQDSNTSLNLSTSDESLVKQIKQKLEESVQLCRQGKTALVD